MGCRGRCWQSRSAPGKTWQMGFVWKARMSVAWRKIEKTSTVERFWHQVCTQTDWLMCQLCSSSALKPPYTECDQKQFITVWWEKCHKLFCFQINYHHFLSSSVDFKSPQGWKCFSSHRGACNPLTQVKTWKSPKLELRAEMSGTVTWNLKHETRAELWRHHLTCWFIWQRVKVCLSNLSPALRASSPKLQKHVLSSATISVWSCR